jgi:hypothetical protein
MSRQQISVASLLTATSPEVQDFLGCHFTYKIEIGLKMGSPEATSTPHLCWEAWASNPMENSSHSSTSKAGVTIHTYQAAYICCQLLFIYQHFLQTPCSTVMLVLLQLHKLAFLAETHSFTFTRSLRILKFANKVMNSN